MQYRPQLVDDKPMGRATLDVKLQLTMHMEDVPVQDEQHHNFSLRNIRMKHRIFACVYHSLTGVKMSHRSSPSLQANQRSSSNQSQEEFKVSAMISPNITRTQGPLIA